MIAEGYQILIGVYLLLLSGIIVTTLLASFKTRHIRRSEVRQLLNLAAPKFDNSESLLLRSPTAAGADAETGVLRSSAALQISMSKLR